MYCKFSIFLTLTPSGEARHKFGIGVLQSKVRCQQGQEALLAFFSVRSISRLKNTLKGGI